MALLYSMERFNPRKDERREKHSFLDVPVLVSPIWRIAAATLRPCEASVLIVTIWRLNNKIKKSREIADEYRFHAHLV